MSNDNEKDERGYVKFTGDYSKLKSMGFEFQKLFANNYMQWCRNHFRVWKKGGDITHDEFQLFKMVRFLRTKPIINERTFNGVKRFVFYKMYYATEYNSHNYDYHPFDDEHIEMFKDYYQAVDKFIKAGGSGADEDFPEPIGDTVAIGEDTMDVLKEFEKLGWYELAYYPKD